MLGRIIGYPLAVGLDRLTLGQDCNYKDSKGIVVVYNRRNRTKIYRGNEGCWAKNTVSLE